MSAEPVFELAPFVEVLGAEAVERASGVRALLQRMIDTAAAGPCAKSKRVAAIIEATSQNTAIVAVNAPPAPFVCSGDDACRRACGRICVHAEERAVLRAARLGWHPLWDLHCIHLHVVDGKPVPSRQASCEMCSRKMLEFGINSMWLFLETGWRRWTAVDFHLETLKNLDLPHTLQKKGRR